MEDGRTIGTFSVFLLLLIFSIIIIIPDNQAEKSDITRAPGDDLYPEPEIDVIFDMEKFESDPHPSEGGDAVISGELICDLPPSVPLGIICTVLLKTQSEDAYVNDLRKYDFNQDLERRNFSLHMNVFLDIKGNTNIDVQVIATWEYSKSAQASSEPNYFDTIIYVPPYGSIDIETPFNHGEIIFNTKEWFELTLEVSNLGNVDAKVELRIMDHPGNIKITMDETEFILNSHQKKIVYARIKQDTSGGQVSTIHIRANSNMPVDEPDDDIIITLRSEEKHQINAPEINVIVGGVFFTVFIVMMIVFGLILRSRRRRATEEFEGDTWGQNIP